MSVNLGKLNKPGLSSASFGHRKTTGTSSQAAKNLSNSTKASRSNTFSFQSTTRRNWVGGQNVTKNGTRYNYQNTRMALNSGNMMVRSSYTPSMSGMMMPGFGNMSQMSINTNSPYMKGQIIGQTVFEGISLLNDLGVFNGLKGSSEVGSASNGSTIDNSMAGLGTLGSAGASSSVKGTIGNMKAQTTSDGLRQAISSAESQFASININPETYQADVDKLKGEVKQADSDVKKQDEAVKNAHTELGNAQESVKTCETTAHVANEALQNALADKSQCSSAYAEATANLVSAEASLAQAKSVPPSTDPGAEAIRQQRIEQAEANVKEAKEAKEKAKTDLDKSADQVMEKDKSLQDAKAKLETEQGKLEKAETAEAKAQKKLEEAKANQTEAKSLLEKKEAELDKLKSDKRDYDDLKSEIADQKERLVKLQNKEKERLSDLTNDISNLSDKVANRQIDNSDGTSVGEKIKMKRNDRNSRKIDEKSKERDELRERDAKTNILADNTNIVTGQNGEELRSGTLPSGKKVFFVGTREVSESEYNALIKTDAS